MATTTRSIADQLVEIRSVNKLAAEGFSAEGIELLRVLRGRYVTQIDEQEVSMRRLEFAKWCIARGLYTDEEGDSDA
jgi:hypothetical protein